MLAVGVGDGFEVVADAAGAAADDDAVSGAALAAFTAGAGVGAWPPVSVVAPPELVAGLAPWLVPPLAPAPLPLLPWAPLLPFPGLLPVPVPVPLPGWPCCPAADPA